MAFGSIVQAVTASQAGKKQQKAADKVNTLEQRIYEESKADFAPYLQVGKDALAALNFELLGGDKPIYGAREKPKIEIIEGKAPSAGKIVFNANVGRDGENEIVGATGGTPDTFAVDGKVFNTRGEAQAFLDSQDYGGREYEGFETTPGYQFRVDEGQKAIERSAAARGGLNSGATLKALERFGQNIASDEYTTYLNRLSSLAGTGQTQANAQASLGQNFATQFGNTLQRGSDARASSYREIGKFAAQGINNTISAIATFGTGGLGGLAGGALGGLGGAAGGAAGSGIGNIFGGSSAGLSF